MPPVPDTILPPDALDFLSRCTLETLMERVEACPAALEGIVFPEGVEACENFGLDALKRVTHVASDPLHIEMIEASTGAGTEQEVISGMEGIMESVGFRKSLALSLPRAVSRRIPWTLGLSSRTRALTEAAARMTREFSQSTEHLSAFCRDHGADLVRLCAHLSRGRVFLAEMEARDPNLVEARILSRRLTIMECTLTQNLGLATSLKSWRDTRRETCADLQMTLHMANETLGRNLSRCLQASL